MDVLIPSETLIFSGGESTGSPIASQFLTQLFFNVEEVTMYPILHVAVELEIRNVNMFYGASIIFFWANFGMSFKR